MEPTESMPSQTRPPGVATVDPGSVLLPGHDVPLGRYTTVRRLLPQRSRRMVGAWCFVDHFGPDDVAQRPGMEVPPHPHTGLQTVTWLLDGEILHRDSLGSVQPIRPGQLNVMTSGHGIAHSERSPADHPPLMHGVQLWVALPDPARSGPADFAHHAQLPRWRDGALDVTLLVGELGGERSPARVHTPLVGAQLELTGTEPVGLPLRPDFEYALLALDGAAEVDGVPLAPGALLWLGTGRTQFTLRGAAGTRLMLLGGTPFEEPLVMWWNFVGRNHEEIQAAREDWMAGRRFGTVAEDPDPPLPAPALPTVRLKARDRAGGWRD
ncbi:pirin family protein [Micromonospora fiedleri]|uniref:Pirin family protein n=1 Tax=Micromonospora fiedleri TaxID=1157498 RepID=A0ABS1UP07_9ACTN|nr:MULTISPECIES: pirin family protein [Micromonospora]MBL6278081.1 pirin family protein [Micromonospora fiedleri]WSK41186.1 pirin family protein [Micromonospora maris]